MSAELLVNVTPRETRAALVENGVLQEVFLERANRRGLISNLYQGKAVRVLPGMQAAFIDIGLERTAFLHANDIASPTLLEDGIEAPRADSVRQLVSEGDEILVQVLKDPIGSKGARLTTYVTLPSRFLVYMPKGRGIGVSSRIEAEPERLRLREAVESFAPAGQAGGWIVRTAAEDCGLEALRADMLFLMRSWELIQERARQAAPGQLVHEDLPLHLRVLRDQLGRHIDRVLVDSPDAHRRMVEFVMTFMPDSVGRVEQSRSDRPLFDLYGVEDEIGRALQRNVPLKSGGHLVVDQTEAMTTIDVNTGAFVGHRNLEDTVFRTNLEAAIAIARQLRLRNLGGIIVLDFIDMQDEEHRRQVLQALVRALADDHAKTHVHGFSALGLVEMTRKRTRESLEHLTCRACPTCEGHGFVKTAETVAYEIFREVLRQARQFDFQELVILANREVIELLLDEESAALADLELAIGRPIRLQAEAQYTEDQYDLVLA